MALRRIQCLTAYTVKDELRESLTGRSRATFIPGAATFA